jgi:hypothetical protein
MTNDNDLIRRGDAMEICESHGAAGEVIGDEIAAIPAVAASQPADPVTNADRCQQWHREDSAYGVLIYSLKQDGWRKGEPRMVNDVTIKIENANGSENDLDQIAARILAAIAAQPDPRDAQIAALVDAAVKMAEGIVVECNFDDVHSPDFGRRYLELRAAIASAKGGAA